MRIRTTQGKLVALENVAFTAANLHLLMTLSLSAPNLTLDATEVHTGSRIRVKLYQLDFDFHECSRFNLPA